MNDFKVGFVVGCIFSVVLSISLAVNVDQDFDYHQNRNNRFIELCKALNSTPQSFDNKELTCKNGLTVQYKDWVN